MQMDHSALDIVPGFAQAAPASPSHTPLVGRSPSEVELVEAVDLEAGAGLMEAGEAVAEYTALVGNSGSRPPPRSDPPAPAGRARFDDLRVGRHMIFQDGDDGEKKFHNGSPSVPYDPTRQQALAGMTSRTRDELKQIEATGKYTRVDMDTGSLTLVDTDMEEPHCCAHHDVVAPPQRVYGAMRVRSPLLVTGVCG